MAAQAHARVASEAGRQRTQRMLKGAKRTRLRIADRRPRQRRVTMKGTTGAGKHEGCAAVRHSKIPEPELNTEDAAGG